MPPLPPFQSPKPLRLLHMPRITCMVSVQNGDVVPNLEVLASSNRWPPKATPKKHEAGVNVDTFATASHISATLNSSLAKLATALCALVKGGRKLTPQAGKFREASNMQCLPPMPKWWQLSKLKKKKQKSWESREIPPKKKTEHGNWKRIPKNKRFLFEIIILGLQVCFLGGIHPRARRRRTVAWFLHQSHSKSCRIVCDFVFQGVIKYYLYPNNELCSIEITPNRHTFACVWIPPQQKNRVTL